MSALSARSLAADTSAALGDAPVITVFDRAEPATCLSVRLTRRGVAFTGTAAEAGALVDHMRLGLQPSFFCEVDGVLFEGVLEVVVSARGVNAPASGARREVLLEVVVRSVAPAEDDVSARSLPRT